MKPEWIVFIISAIPMVIILMILALRMPELNRKCREADEALRRRLEKK